MGSFLRENWLWIVLPLVLILGGLLWLIFSGGGEGSDAPFVYNIF